MKVFSFQSDRNVFQKKGPKVESQEQGKEKAKDTESEMHGYKGDPFKAAEDAKDAAKKMSKVPKAPPFKENPYMTDKERANEEADKIAAELAELEAEHDAVMGESTGVQTEGTEVNDLDSNFGKPKDNPY